MTTSSEPRRATYAGLFFVTLATLMNEILLTRIFSVAIWYHFAFMAISVAMFGMTAGAIWVYLRPAAFTVERAPEHDPAFLRCASSSSAIPGRTRRPGSAPSRHQRNRASWHRLRKLPRPPWPTVYVRVESRNWKLRACIGPRASGPPIPPVPTKGWLSRFESAGTPESHALPCSISTSFTG